MSADPAAAILHEKHPAHLCLTAGDDPGASPFAICAFIGSKTLLRSGAVRLRRRCPGLMRTMRHPEVAINLGNGALVS